MRFNKDGTPDKRFKEVNQPDQKEVRVDVDTVPRPTAREMYEEFLRENNISVDYRIVTADNGMLNTSEGYVLVPKKPLIVIIPEFND